MLEEFWLFEDSVLIYRYVRSYFWYEILPFTRPVQFGVLWRLSDKIRFGDNLTNAKLQATSMQHSTRIYAVWTIVKAVSIEADYKSRSKPSDMLCSAHLDRCGQLTDPDLAFRYVVQRTPGPMWPTHRSRHTMITWSSDGHSTKNHTTTRSTTTAHKDNTSTTCSGTTSKKATKNQSTTSDDHKHTYDRSEVFERAFAAHF